MFVSDGLTMQNKTIPVSVYLWNSYPKEKRYHFTKSRFSKLLYLIDWFSVLKGGSQLTEIKWYFDHFGPYEDLKHLLYKPGLFDVREYSTDNGITRYYVSDNKKEPMALPEENSDLSQSNKEHIDDVINETKDMDWNTFVDFVYRTPPVRQSVQYTYIDLPGIAEKNRGTLP